MLSVMIVDDDSIVRRGLMQVIDWNSLGAEVVHSTCTGRLAADYLKNNNADIVISDIKMPDMDGLELAEYISENKPETMVILISAYGEFEYAQRAIHYNVKEYLLKPMTMENIEHIKKIVSDTAIKKKINKQKANRSNGEFKNSVSGTLVANDEEGLKKLLGTGLDIESENVQLIQEYYSELIDCLFDVSGWNSIKYISKTDITDHIMRIDSIESIKQYVDNIIHKFLEIINIDKNNNVKMLATYIANIIENEYHNPDINVNMIADRLDMDAFYIGTMFKSYRSESIGAYINSLRLKEACRMLKETNLSVGEISAKVGFNDSNYFSRKFKEKLNMTPMEYRKN